MDLDETPAGDIGKWDDLSSPWLEMGYIRSWEPVEQFTLSFLKKTEVKYRMLGGGLLLL